MILDLLVVAAYNWLAVNTVVQLHIFHLGPPTFYLNLDLKSCLHLNPFILLHCIKLTSNVNSTTSLLDIESRITE